MGKNQCEVRMKYISIAVIFLFLLAGCVTTPNDTNIQSTIESAVNSAVSTAIAPYEARYQELFSQDLVTLKELNDSQTTQNAQILEIVSSQIEDLSQNQLSNQMINPVPTATAASTVYEFVDGKPVPTEAAKKYKNDPTCVDRFTYVSDINVPDGMTITPNTNFTKSWYITNSGDCTWNSNYKLVYTSGSKVGKGTSFSILKPENYIFPGESLVVSADLLAPNEINTDFTTYWALQSDRGEIFGAGDAKNVYLSSSFRVTNSFNAIQNFGSLTCSDQFGYLTCGSSSLTNGRGVVYYDSTPMVESHRSFGPAIVAAPPIDEDNSIVRFEFGPLRFPRGSTFYTNFCCRPNTPHCDVQVRLFVREPGYEERLIAEEREWNDGLMNEFKFMLDDVYIFDQEFYYILEVQANGGSTAEDSIMFTNLKLY